jgi:hypothetical protein
MKLHQLLLTAVLANAIDAPSEAFGDDKSAIDDREFEIEFLDPGARAFDFTFG